MCACAFVGRAYAYAASDRSAIIIAVDLLDLAPSIRSIALLKVRKAQLFRQYPPDVVNSVITTVLGTQCCQARNEENPQKENLQKFLGATPTFDNRSLLHACI